MSSSGASIGEDLAPPLFTRAAIVFYRTPTIDSRVTLTSDLVESLWPRRKSGEHPSDLEKDWKGLQSDIKDHLPTRNRLAHDPASLVFDFYEAANAPEYKIEVRQASYMSETQRLRKPYQPLNAIGIEEIEAHMKIVSSLINRLRNFRDAAFPKPPATPFS
jgi:hypothetical protein